MGTEKQLNIDAIWIALLRDTGWRWSKYKGVAYWEFTLYMEELTMSHTNERVTKKAH